MRKQVVDNWRLIETTLHDIFKDHPDWRYGGFFTEDLAQALAARGIRIEITPIKETT